MSQRAPTWDQMYRTNSGSEIVMDDEVVVPSVEQPVPIPESEQIRIFARNYVFDGLKQMNLFEYLTRPENNEIYSKIELDTERAILEFLQKLQPLQPISEVQNLQPFKTEIAQKFYKIVIDEKQRSKIQSPYEDYEQFQFRILRNLRENPLTYEIPDRRYQPLRKCKVNYETDRVYGFSSAKYSQYRKWMKKKIPPKNFIDYAILGYARDPQFFGPEYPYSFLYESDYIIVPHTAPKWKQIINFTDYNAGGFTVVGGMATEELRANFFGGRPMIGCITMLGHLDTDYMHAISYCLVPPQVDVHGVKQMGNLYVFTTYKIADRGYRESSNNTWIHALARKVEQLVGENIRAWELYSQTLQKDLGTCASWALTFLYTLCRNPFGVYPIANKLRDAKGQDFWEAIYVPLQKWRTEHPDEATNPGPFDLLRGSGIQKNVFKFIQDEIKDGGLIMEGSGPKYIRQSEKELRLEALAAYQSHPENCDDECKNRIEDALVMSRYMTRVVYRGQKFNPFINKSRFFSTSKSLEIAYDFTQGDCCLFEIHLMNVPAIDMNEELKWGSLYPYQEEVLVMGGGTFFKDEAMTIPGWEKTDKPKDVLGIRNDMNYFVTYYTLD